MDQSLDQKIDKKMPATVWSRSKGTKRRTPGMNEKGRTAYHLDGLIIMANDAKWLKMVIYN